MNDQQRPSYRVIDGFLPREVAEAAAAAWPEPGWDYWLPYANALEHKRACNKWPFIPAPLVAALRELLLLPAGEALGVDNRLLPDLGLHGAGLHDMGPGDWLDLHLDCDRHPDSGFSRRVNAILYLTPGWRAEWGGELELWADLTAGTPAAAVAPLFNRLVLFQTDDDSYHGVPHPIACPADVTRRSLAAYWWGRRPGPGKRPRAQFVPYPGRPTSAAEDELRRQRMGR